MKAALLALFVLFTVQSPLDTKAHTRDGIETPDAVYVVAYVDVLASGGSRASLALRRYRNASRLESGAISASVFSQILRPGGFLILEVWQDKLAWEAHTKSEATEQLRVALKPVAIAPWDVHPQSNYFGGSSLRGLPGVMTSFVHVDVIPSYNDAYMRFLSDYVDGTRTTRGLLGFTVMQGLAPRTNHFTVIEEWRNQRALEEHQRSEVNQRYRTAIAPQLGALYDERVYKRLQ